MAKQGPPLGGIGRAAGDLAGAAEGAAEAVADRAAYLAEALLRGLSPGQATYAWRIERGRRRGLTRQQARRGSTPEHPDRVILPSSHATRRYVCRNWRRIVADWTRNPRRARDRARRNPAHARMISEWLNECRTRDLERDPIYIGRQMEPLQVYPHPAAVPPPPPGSGRMLPLTVHPSRYVDPLIADVLTQELPRSYGVLVLGNVSAEQDRVNGPAKREPWQLATFAKAPRQRRR